MRNFIRAHSIGFLTEAFRELDRFPVGQEVMTTMGGRRFGRVIKPFNWKQSTVRRKRPPKHGELPIRWDDGEVGYHYFKFMSPVSRDAKRMYEDKDEEGENLTESRNDEELYNEVGVDYSFSKNDPMQKEFKYKLVHDKSGKSWLKTVWTYSDEDFLKLITHWNRSSQWHVVPK
jgi:hypothetical protein